MEEILKDERFAHVASDPRYKKLPKAFRKVKIDKRFQSIFKDKQFRVEYTVDKRGRPVNHSSSDNFRKYYELSSEDDTDDDTDTEQRENLSASKLTKSKKTKNDKHSKKSTSAVKIDKNDKGIKAIKKCEDNNDDVDSESDEQDVDINEKIYDKSVKSDDSASDHENSKVSASIECSSSKLDSAKARRKLPEDVREKLHNLNVDYARGMGTLMTDSSSDEETDQDFEEEVGEELEHDWGELDKDAETTESGTHRLAICNMDWDRIRAVDLMVLCSSFLPTGGHIKSITIYPSEFGLNRMKEEELKGPIELVNDKLEKVDDVLGENNDDDDGDDDNDCDEESKEGSKYHMERLRQYQLNRLKYYYAVVVCDSPETASKIYSECDGMEYESSATKLDLRFIPDDVTFDEEPKEVCTEIKDVNKYEPRFFVNTALQQGKVTCTWDETDPARTQLAEKIYDMKGGADNLNDEDLQMFLASSSGEDENSDDNNSVKNEENGSNVTSSEDNSSEEEDEKSSTGKRGRNTDKSIEKYRSLLNKIQEAEEKKKNRDVEMEITWGVGLKEKAQELVDQKLKEKSEQTPFEKMIEKKKERRKQKREEKMKNKKKGEANSNENENADNNVLFSDDELPDDIDLNDDYFKDELGNETSNKSKKNNKNKKKGRENELNEEEKQKRDELELLLADDEDNDHGVHKKHFNFKEIQDREQNPVKKKRKGRKQIIKNNKHEKNLPVEEDNFEVDVNDKRFDAVFTSHHYNIDPADSHFRKTKGMDAFIKEKISRKYKGSEAEKQDYSGNEEYPRANKIPKIGTDLSSVVSSIKKKTKGIK